MTAGQNGHRHTSSVSQAQNHKAQLANAYNELGKELSSQKIRVVGNYTLGKVIGEVAQPLQTVLLCTPSSVEQARTGRCAWAPTV